MTKTMAQLEEENKALREALGNFVIGFTSKKDKLDRRWSLGYWEGTDPGLVLVGGSETEDIKNTRFNAVLAYDKEHIENAMALLAEEKTS